MMTLVAVARDVPLGLGVDAFVESLEVHPKFAVVRGRAVVDSLPADAYLLCANDVQVVTEELADVAARTPDRLSRVILVGAAHGLLRGAQESAPGTIAELMERYRIAGCLTPEALTSWREAPSWFAGPKDLMEPLGSNAFKAFQSENYALWFSAPGATIGDFLASYVAVLAAHVTDPSNVERSAMNE